LVFDGPDAESAEAAGVLASVVAASGVGLAAPGGVLGWTAVAGAAIAAGVWAARRGRFRLTLAPDGPWLERRALGLTWARWALPTGIVARREGLLDWGDDGEDSSEALAALSLEGPAAPFDPILIGTRADADDLPAAIASALAATYGAHRDPSPARLARNRPWPLRLQAWLSRRVSRAPGRGRPGGGGLVSSTPFAGLIDWELPHLGVGGALVLLAGAALLSRAGREDLTFALLFSVLVLGSWRFFQLVREDRVHAAVDDGGLREIVIERRWLGLCLRRRLLPRPTFVLTATWQSAHPTELAAWSQTRDAFGHVRAALDAEAAAVWAARRPDRAR
jgi:hypothetical protein